jgi:hypothetical protein
MKNIIKVLKVALLPGSITGLLIVLFLSGKIIDYPRGTPKGGITAAIGVFAIMVSVVAINYLIYRLKKLNRVVTIKNEIRN